MSKASLGIASIIASAVIWGVTIPVMKVNLEDVPPLTLAFLRFAPAALLAFYFSEFRKVKFKDIVRIGFWAIIGISLNISLLVIGLRYTSVVDATLIFALNPIITSLLAVFALREKIIPLHVVGIILALVGVVIYITYPIVTGGDALKLNLLGNVLITISMLAASIYLIGSKKLFDDYHPSTIAGISFLVGALCFLPVSLWETYNQPGWMNSLTLFNWFSLIFLSLGSSFAAFLLLEWGLNKVAVHISAVISYLTPAVSIVIAATFLQERLNPSFIFSLILIVIGIFLVTKTRPHAHHRIHKV